MSLLIPYIDAAGHLCAGPGAIALVVLASMFTAATLFGSAKKQINRRRMRQGRGRPWFL